MKLGRRRTMTLLALMAVGLWVVALLAARRLRSRWSWPGGRGTMTLFALMTAEVEPHEEEPPPLSSIEVVDLINMATVRSLSIGARLVSSLEVSPDGQRLYVVDRTQREIAVLSATTGGTVASIPLTYPRDCVLSADGSTLYVTTDSSVVAIDTTSNTVRLTLATGTDTPLGIALSPDGSTLGTACASGGPNPAAYLVEAATLTLKARIPIAGNVAGCVTSPNDVAFTDNGRLLLWDSNCDSLYQVDVASAAQLTAQTINLGRDTGSFFNFNNMLSYSAASARAYATKESLELAIMDPTGPSGTLVGGFSGVPFVPVLTPDGLALFIAVLQPSAAGGADTLDRYDTTSNTFMRGVYTFSAATMTVRDMQILARRSGCILGVAGLPRLLLSRALSLVRGNAATAMAL